MASPPAPLHLGVTPWRGLSADRIVDQARLAESLGYRSLWLPESHFLDHGAVPAPLLLLAAAAAVTTDLELGTVSLLLPIRDPLLLAEEIAVLDRLSAGRVILGVGRGFRPALFRAFGVDPKEKRSRFETHLERMIHLWAGERIAEGERAGLAPRPKREPHPPIWVAAFGPKALAQAARLGLPYLASPLEPMSTLIENYQRHAEWRTESRRSLAVPIMRTVFVSEQPELLREARQKLEAESASLSSSRSPRLRQAAESPIEERALIGSPDEVQAAIESYREALGMTHLIARHPQGLERDVVDKSLKTLPKLLQG